VNDFFARRTRPKAPRSGAGGKAQPAGQLVARERRFWMRLRSHAVVFDRDPEWPRFRDDPSGQVVRILQLWMTESRAASGATPDTARHFLGNVRYCQGWMSRAEVSRLYRRVTAAAHLEEQCGALWRTRLTQFLRQHIRSQT